MWPKWCATTCRRSTAMPFTRPATRCSPPSIRVCRRRPRWRCEPGLLEYDLRHGYRGATAKVDMSKITTPAQFDAQLEEFPVIGGLKPAIVEKVEARSAKIYVKDLGVVTLPWEKLSWARRELPDEKVDRAPTQASEILSRGDVIYTVGRTAESLLFVQVPRGAKRAGVGGPQGRRRGRPGRRLRFLSEQIQPRDPGRRQPGSGFKPFVYAAAFDKGFTPASVVLDAPVVIDEQGKEEAWRPRGHRPILWAGAPARGAGAFPESGLGALDARHRRRVRRNYVTRFGFDKSQLPDDLTLALGTAELSPLAGGHRLRHLRQRRLQGQLVLHRPHRGCSRQGAAAGEPCHRLRAMRPAPAMRPPQEARPAARVEHAGREPRTMVRP